MAEESHIGRRTVRHGGLFGGGWVQRSSRGRTGGRGRGGTGGSAMLDFLMRRVLGARSDCHSIVSKFQSPGRVSC
jgi:hypothetical protein